MQKLNILTSHLPSTIFIHFFLEHKAVDFCSCLYSYHVKRNSIQGFFETLVLLSCPCQCTTKFDAKTEYPDFTSSFHYIHSFLPRTQSCWLLQLYTRVDPKVSRLVPPSA